MTYIMNANKSNELNFERGTDTKILNFINELSYVWDAKIVISSSHRSKFNTREEIINFFKNKFNVDMNLHDDFKTKKFISVDEIEKIRNNNNIVSKQYSIRGDEIYEWLNRNDCKNYIILDDDSDFHNEQKLHHVKCDVYNGFNFECYLKFIEISGLTHDCYEQHMWSKYGKPEEL